MHSQDLARWQHAHSFLGAGHAEHQRRTQAVIVLTAVMMVVEIAAGTHFRSMALLADGWHMGTHVGALSISALAYGLARRLDRDRAFSLGTGKFGDLAGFTSAVVLALISVLIGYESVTRLIQPVPVGFTSALLVAALGLVVNLLSAWMLAGGHVHWSGGVHLRAHAEHGPAAHEHAHDHPHAEHGHPGTGPRAAADDHNLRSAYLHVLADGLTSVLAIVALLGGWWLGWEWLDPAMGLVGAVIIARWSYGLIRDASRVLLDMEADASVAEHMRQDVEADSEDRVADLHLWRIGPGHLAAMLTVVTHDARAPDYYKALLGHHPELAHVTVEVQRCPPERLGAAR